MKPEGKEDGGREGEGEPAARLQIYDRRVYRGAHESLAVLEEKFTHGEVVLIALRDEVTCERGSSVSSSPCASRAREKGATHRRCARGSCC